MAKLFPYDEKGELTIPWCYQGEKTKFTLKYVLYFRQISFDKSLDRPEWDMCLPFGQQKFVDNKQI